MKFSTIIFLLKWTNETLLVLSCFHPPIFYWTIGHLKRRGTPSNKLTSPECIPEISRKSRYERSKVFQTKKKEKRHVPLFKSQMLPRLICLNPIIPSKTLPHLPADGHNSIQSRTPLWFQRHLLYIHFSSLRSLKNYVKKSITTYLRWEGRQFNSIRFLLAIR